MKWMGLDMYRFSISWPRILPKGKLDGGVNQEGIKYYNNLINELVANGVRPLVTLFHWDLPQALEEEYGGFLSPNIVNDYRDFVNICFESFGDRVKIWLTLNEPEIYAKLAYAKGVFPPLRCSSFINPKCNGGNSGTEPYIVVHNLLMAHATAVELYRRVYQNTQKGEIGLAHATEWYEPLTNSTEDRDAAVRMEEFHTGWIMNPLTTGDYPPVMKSLVGDRLPKFSPKQSQLLAGSYDFFGLNYYTSFYASNNQSYTGPPTVETDNRVTRSRERNGVLIGETSASGWITYYPEGLRYQLAYITKKYNPPKIYITENGMDNLNNASVPLKDHLNDVLKIKYHYHHFESILKAIEDGAKVQGYSGWSLMDNIGFMLG